MNDDFLDMLSALSEEDAEFLIVGAYASAQRSVSSPMDEIRIPVLSRAHLIANKKASGRPQDLADVAWLEGSDEGG